MIESPTIRSRYQNSFQDGPILIFRSDNQYIDIFEAFFDRSNRRLANYTIFSENRPFLKLSVCHEDSFENLNQWAALKSQSLKESESITTYYSEFFQTDDEDLGIAFLWENTDNSIDFVVGVELTQTGASDPKWTFAYFESNGTDVNHSDFSSALSIAESISYLPDNYIPLDEYFTNLSSSASTSTTFPVSDEGFSWFSSPWFGVFYDSGKIGFIIIGWDGFIRTLQRLTTRTGFGLRAVVGYGPIKNHFLIYFVMILLIGSISICPQKMELNVTIIIGGSGKNGMNFTLFPRLT